MGQVAAVTLRDLLVGVLQETGVIDPGDGTVSYFGDDWAVCDPPDRLLDALEKAVYQWAAYDWEADPAEEAWAKAHIRHHLEGMQVPGNCLG